MDGTLPNSQELWDKIPTDAQAILQAFFVRFEQLQQDNLQLRQQLEQLQKDNQRLSAHNQKLLEQLQQNSTNSSRPPSTDAPKFKRQPPTPPSGNKPGGQQGHSLQRRPDLEPTQPPVVLQPTACRKCGLTLTGDDPQPLRHQVIDLPPIVPQVIEYHLQRRRCPCCGITTCATLPAGVPTGQYGPRLQAMLAILAGAYRLGKRPIEDLCADVFNVPISAGQVCALEADTADATDPVVQPARDFVQNQDVMIDETSWRHNRQRGWLWAVVAATVTVFHIALSRSAQVARELLGPDYAHVAGTDRYSAYTWLDPRQRQVCWSHLQRDFQAMVDRGGEGQALGEELLCCAEELFARWQRVRDGTLQRSTVRQYLGELRGHVRSQLELGTACGCAKTAGTCREILKLEPALWTFVRKDGVEPTNNGVERAIRHPVQWRKTSYGTMGESGRRFVANILTIVATCRQQGRNALEFLTECGQAKLRGGKPPSLVPQTL